MAEEEAQALSYVQETVLKKRKRNEEWVVKKRERLQSRKRRSKEYSRLAIKRPEQFVKEFREKELDLVRMKHRLKHRKSTHGSIESKLLFVLRIHGSEGMHPRTRNILNRLRLKHIYDGVFLKANESTSKMLLGVEPFITYGYPNMRSIRDLVYKKGCGYVEKERVPMTDNNIVEQALGKYDIICLEDIIHEIATVGPHFKEVTRFLWPFKLKKPETNEHFKKKAYKDGGDTGNREDKINELISKLN